MKILVCPSGEGWSVTDVEDGLIYGLEQQRVDVVRVNEFASTWPEADAVILVDPIRYPPELFKPMLGAAPMVTGLFTESPYEPEKELAVAAQVQGCWTHERLFVSELHEANPCATYLPHAWHPEIHTPKPQPGDDRVPAHDVVFVGSGFRERIAFFNGIDWGGINLGLYGVWEGLGLTPQVEACVRSAGPIPNRQAAALYRRAKIGLNLYRRFAGLGRETVKAASMNPRAYELAACGTFQLTEYRQEASERFGRNLLTFQSPKTAAYYIRSILQRPASELAEVTATIRAAVQHDSWVDRAGQVLRDVSAWSGDLKHVRVG